HKVAHLSICAVASCIGKGLPRDDGSPTPHPVGAVREPPLQAKESLDYLEKYGPVERKSFVGVRRAIAQRLSKTTGGATPLVTHFDLADVTKLDDVRKKQKATYMPFIIKAVVAALKEHPMLNAALDESTNEIVYLKYYNVGIAVDTPAGLMVPVIKDADKKNVAELGEALTGIAERARTRKISLDEMRGGSFTISNVGAVGGIYATPLMNYPQSAILALGRIRQEPLVREGKVEVGKVLPLSCTFDHRIVDGADAARFCNKVGEVLSQPETLS
ncbi:MAG: 2-oxo acid dehydrogenase subunit E2, partial [Deltaproteobacteria bacterium]|nr:2-oxo acid dehydrogenase subunit E2 [Deltaproteobacteria bacterium]